MVGSTALQVSQALEQITANPVVPLTDAQWDASETALSKCLTGLSNGGSGISSGTVATVMNTASNLLSLGSCKRLDQISYATRVSMS